MKYILNSAVLTAFGLYNYKQVPLLAEALTNLSSVQVPVNRKIITMQAGDEALVFRLVFPQGYRPDPSQKGKMGMDFILKNSEVGILKRIE